MVIGIQRCTCRDCPFSSASKRIDLGLGFQVLYTGSPQLRLCTKVSSYLNLLKIKDWGGLAYLLPS